MADFGSDSAIGASVRDVEQADVSRSKLPALTGALVEDVRADSPAAKAGLQNGDVIVEFDGETVRSARQLTRLVRETPEGRSVHMAVMRDGRRTELDVTPASDGSKMSRHHDAFDEPMRNLAELGRRFNFDRHDFDGPVPGQGRLGVTVEELTPQLAAFFGVKDGVLVSGVRENDSPAARAGIKAGDVITAVNQRPVATRNDLLRILRDADDDREATIELTREHKTMTVKATLDAPGTGHGRRARLRTAA